MPDFKIMQKMTIDRTAQSTGQMLCAGYGRQKEAVSSGEHGNGTGQGEKGGFRGGAAAGEGNGDGGAL